MIEQECCRILTWNLTSSEPKCLTQAAWAGGERHASDRFSRLCIRAILMQPLGSFPRAL